MNKLLSSQDTTAVQVMNEIILEAKKIHDDIYRRRKTETRRRMMQINKQIAAGYRRKQGVTAEAARAIQNEIMDLQQQLADDIEMKETASSNRISNYYKDNIGKNVPATYRIAKEKKHYIKWP